MRVVVTGGAGFIGSAVVRYLIRDTLHSVLNVDKLTYAGNLESLTSVAGDPRYHFAQLDICNPREIAAAIREFRPHAVMHLAAESHVDRSIDRPADFVNTNVIGTYQMLECALGYCRELDAQERSAFRFLHVSTDEVFGDLGPSDPRFNESTPYNPSSPYSATKAAADHLARAWHRTFGLPVIVTNCSNNYGPYQFPEKLIPLMILSALEGRPLPVYGDGRQIRDWLYVEDHARALVRVLEAAAPGTTYSIGGDSEMPNIEVVHAVCDLLDALVPHRRRGISSFADLIQFVQDRPGHDSRYAIDSSAIRRDLDWRPVETFASGIRHTVRWYLDNDDWCRSTRDRYDQSRLGRGS